MLATTVWGILWAIHQPAQQSIQADIHSGRELVNGIALLNTAMNLTSMIGLLIVVWVTPWSPRCTAVQQDG